MNAGLKTNVSSLLKRTAWAGIVCSVLLSAAAVEAREPVQYGSSSFSLVGQGYGGGGGRQSRRGRGRSQQGNYAPTQTYIVQQPAPYLVPQAPIAFFDTVLGIRGITVPGYGVQVLAVTPFGLGASLGLEPGDIVVQINGRPVQSSAGMRVALTGWHGQFKVLVLDVRTGTYQARYGSLYQY